MGHQRGIVTVDRAGRIEQHSQQQVVNQSAGVIIGDTSIDFDTLLPDLESRLEAMDIGPLLGLWFQTLVVGLTMNILSICIFLVTYGRMIEIYAVTALGPIPLATLGNAEWRGMGQNYLKSLGYIFASCFVNTITAICKFGIPSTERMYLPISNLPLCR